MKSWYLTWYIGFMLIEKYQYPELIRNTTPTGRTYITPDNETLPSVTTILSKTTDKSFLDTWRARIGDAEADYIVKLSSDIGSAMHDNLENWIKGVPLPTGSAQVRRTGRALAEVVIEKGLCNIDEVWGLEKHLYYPGLYAGTADVIGVWKGKPAIMDFKNTRKPKKEAWIGDYYKQLCAYGMAHNKLYGTDIRTGVIMMVAREDQCFGEYQEFEIDLNDHQDKWLCALEEYYR